MIRRVFALFFLLVVGVAHAGQGVGLTSTVTGNTVGYTTSVYTYGGAVGGNLPVAPPSGTPSSMTVPDGWATGHAAGGQPNFTGKANGPIPGYPSKSNPTTVTVPINMPTAAKAIGNFARKVIIPLQYGMALYDLAQELGFHASNSDGLPGAEVAKDGCVAPGCYWYTYSNTAANQGPTGAQSCTNWAIANRGAGAYGVFSYNAGSQTNGYCYAYNSNGTYWNGGGTARVGSLSSVPSSIEELEAKIAEQSGWPSTSAIDRAIKDAMDSGEPLTVGTPTVTGPSSQPGPSSTSTTNNPDGTTSSTTNNSTINITYNGNTYTTNVTNNSTVTNSTPTGTTTQTTTSTSETPPESDLCKQHPGISACQPLGDATDTALPAQPQLYTPKYPAGPQGVWDTQVALIKATPLFALPAQLAPNLGDGGCPNWSIPLNVGIRNWGTFDTSIPCNVWTFLRLCIIVGALFLARRLIFGG